MQFFLATPQIFMLIMACLAVLFAAFNGRESKSVYVIVQFSLLAAAFLVWHVWSLSGMRTITAFNGAFQLDHLSVVLNISVLLLSFFALGYVRDYWRSHGMPLSECLVLAMLSVVGMMVLINAADLLSLYLGLELMALPTYALVAIRRDHGPALEAAIKYFVMGAIASGFLLYGMSILFGAAQSLQLSSIAQVIASTPASEDVLVVFGMVFLMGGIAFKLGAAPFHAWVPDVYDGAPLSTTLFISTAPKVAALALIMRLLPEALPGLHLSWQPILIVMAILSLAIGNISAIIQTNVKRMLAFSSIAHMGYFLLALATNSTHGYRAATFYMISYAIMSLAAFGVLTLLESSGDRVDTLDDLKGLNTRHPWIAFVMLMVMFSMAGVPPLVGFMAKLSVIEALIQVHSVTLAVIAILFAIIGVYYYIRVVKAMYFDAPDNSARVKVALGGQIILSINGLLVLALGLFPGVLISMIG